MRALFVGLAVLLFACGDDGVGKLADAPLGPDAPDIDAPSSGVVKLTISSGGTAVAGVRVIFQNPDSSVVLSTTTDTAGVASATMGVGGFVTAIDAFPQPVPSGIAPPSQLHTFAGVKPGDELVLRDDNGGNNTVLNVTFNLPLDGAIDQYVLHTPCGVQNVTGGGGSGSGSGLPGGPVTLFGCPATSDILVEGASKGTTVKTLFKANVALSEGAIIDLTAESYVNTTDSTFTYTNIPARFGIINLSSTIATTRGTIFDIFGSFDAINGNGAFTTKAPALIAGTFAVTFTNFFDTFGIHTVASWGAATNTYTLDTSGALLPEFTGAPLFDIANHTTSWPQAATGAKPDLSVHELQLSRPSDGQQWSWQIAAPFSDAKVATPVLPTDGARFNPAAGDNGEVSNLITAKVPGGYDAVRELLLADSFEAVIVGPTGQASVQEFFQGGKGKRIIKRNKAPVIRSLAQTH